MSPLKPRPKRPIDPASVRPYDLTAPKPVVVPQLKGLDAAYERFAKSATRTIGLRLARPTSVSVISTDSARLKDYETGVAWPAAVAVLKLADATSGAERGGLFVFDSALVLHLVSALFGAQEEKAKDPGASKSLTRIELSVVKDLSTAMLVDLNACWAGLLPLAASFNRMESSAELIGELSPEDVVVITTFRLQVDKVAGAFSIALPYLALRPYEKALARL